MNPFVLLIPETGPFILGWLFVLEFIFCLAMALKCYPLQPGGLLAMEAVILGLTTPELVFDELVTNFKVILLLMFMVAGIYFMKDLLLFTFTKIVLRVRSKIALSLLFSVVAAFLSAFLDALTVTAVIISVAVGFYTVYHRVAAVAGTALTEDVQEENQEDLEKFRQFLRSLMMHGAVGTALGGVMTLVGEPQNLLIADRMGWEFMEFIWVMAPVTMPVFVAGILTCLVLELTKSFGYGGNVPPSILKILQDFDREEAEARSTRENAALIMQALAMVFLIIALASHVAEVGIIGLAVIVIQTAFNGVIDEHQIGDAFKEALPFTALLSVFFVIVAVIHSQHLFDPVTSFVLSLPTSQQPGMLYIANGMLSIVSDNVFVATVYISEVEKVFLAGGMERELYDKLGIAINTGTNIPSVLTPNGQAAFLFLLTSSLAPLIRLSYGKMVQMALPYFFTMGIVGWAMVQWNL